MNVVSINTLHDFIHSVKLKEKLPNSDPDAAF